MKEIWKDIKGYEGRYEASNYGAVRNAKTKQIRNKYKEGGISQQKMADLLGVAQTTIGRIIRGERYADIEII